MTYGDGVADVNIKELIDFHNAKKKIATVTATQPVGRFGALSIDNEDSVKNFLEKPVGDGQWINGGFFVLGPEVFDFIEGDLTIFEKSPMENLVKQNQLTAYRHKGFWMPMDKLSDKFELENLWARGNAPWKIWE